MKDTMSLHTKTPLQLHTDTMIRIKNLDRVRHDFGSLIFLNTLMQVEGNGIVTYGKSVEGLFIDLSQEASIHMILDHPGRVQFQCSILKDMKGEISSDCGCRIICKRERFPSYG